MTYGDLNVCKQGKVILEASRQVAVEADYCMATGLHATPVDDTKFPTTPSGYFIVISHLVLRCCDRGASDVQTRPECQ